MSVRLEPFNRDHLVEFQSWFDKSQSGDQSAYPDEIWFNYLNYDEVLALAVVNENEEMVAQVQVDREPDDIGFFALSVNPDVEYQGVAQSTLETLFKHPFVQNLVKLIGYVEKGNEPSRSALEKTGFYNSGEEDEQGFVQYVYQLH